LEGNYLLLINQDIAYNLVLKSSAHSNFLIIRLQTDKPNFYNSITIKLNFIEVFFSFLPVCIPFLNKLIMSSGSFPCELNTNYLFDSNGTAFLQLCYSLEGYREKNLLYNLLNCNISYNKLLNILIFCRISLRRL